MPLFRYFRRKWIATKPFPDKWLSVLENRVPVYKKMPADCREKLQNRIQIFLDEKYFEGCSGLNITADIRVIIAAYACILILEEKADYYSDLQAILVYPNDYIAPVQDMDDGGVVTEGFEPRSGEYWGTGNIVLSWAEIEKTLQNRDYGQNLIYHEFSHLLDDRYGLTAGITEQGMVLRKDDWSSVIARSYKKLEQLTREKRKSVLDSYGITSPAELFSVATEAFFEKPDELHREMPDLYRMLKRFYRLDPMQWSS